MQRSSRSQGIVERKLLQLTDRSPKEVDIVKN